MTMCHAVLFISLNSTLVFLLEAYLRRVVTTVALSKSSRVAYGRSSKRGQCFFVTFCYISPLLHYFTPIVWQLSLTRKGPLISFTVPQCHKDSFVRHCLANSLLIVGNFSLQIPGTPYVRIWASSLQP